MARYNKREIEELCKRLEARADSVVNATPAVAGDMKAAAILLRLTLILAQVDAVETGPICLPDRSRRI